MVGVEKPQPQGGRLDLLLKDEKEGLLYEVELMLGRTDESHIIRTIEYWEKEERRYRDYDHCPVLVAEEITSRFFNVIALFNRYIPIIAIQVQALKVVQSDDFLLHFTRVLDQSEAEPKELAPEVGPQSVGRDDWERRVPQSSLDIVDACFSILREVDSRLTLTYKQKYIGLAVEGLANNYVLFWPKKRFTKVATWVSDREHWIAKLKNDGIEEPVAMARYDEGIQFSLTTPAEVQQHRAILKELFQAARSRISAEGQ